MLELLSEYGLQLSEQEYSQRYPGLRNREILDLLRQDHGFHAPESLVKRIQEFDKDAFYGAMRAIPGMTSLFRRLKVPKSMVSNGSVLHVQMCLQKVRLLSSVDGHIFSAEQVENPKPHPDVYLFALEKIGLQPHHTIVVEDSPTGVMAAKRAGLQSIGFLGAAHVNDGHANELILAGADFIAEDAQALGRLLETMGVL